MSTDLNPVSPASHVPISVNYHFTRQCNYECKFCFHTALTSHVEKLDNAKKGMRMLRDAGTQKVNFSGGEPFLNAAWLGEMVRFCKQELGMQSVSVVSNGSMIQRPWFEKYGQHLDVLAISCDSFDSETLYQLGRRKRGGGRENAAVHLHKLEEIRAWCTEFDVIFKINSVICSLNVNEDMNENIARLNPKRWKVFQVLAIEGENTGAKAKRDVSGLLISDQQFQAFCDRHAQQKSLIRESNDTMRNSYLILNEYLQFLNCTEGEKRPTKSILEVGVVEAMSDAGWDVPSFHDRKGKYEWSRSALPKSSCGAAAAGAADVDIEDLCKR